VTSFSSNTPEANCVEVLELDAFIALGAISTSFSIPSTLILSEAEAPEPASPESAFLSQLVINPKVTTPKTQNLTRLVFDIFRYDFIFLFALNSINQFHEFPWNSSNCLFP